MTRAGGPVRHVAFYTQYTIYGYPKNLSVIIFWKKHDIHGMKNILMILRAVFHYKEPFVQWMLKVLHGTINANKEHILKSVVMFISFKDRCNL